MKMALSQITNKSHHPVGFGSNAVQLAFGSRVSSSIRHSGGGQDLARVPNIIYDYVSILTCSPLGPNTYEYFLVLTEPTKTYGLLGTRRVAANDSWKATVDKILREARSPLKPSGIVRLDRWFVPGIDRLSSHAIYLALIKPEMKSKVSNSFVGVWLKLSQIREYQNAQKLVSLDVLDIISNACVTCPTSGIQAATEYEFTEANFIEVERGGPNGSKRTGFEPILAAAQFGKSEQEVVYKEFMKCAAPYFTINLSTFEILMKQLGWPESTLPDLFTAFDIQNRGALNYPELLFGLAAVEPSTPHGGPPAEIRCRYIFRFYDRNKDGKLDFDEFKGIVMDIRLTRGQLYDPMAIQEEAVQSAKVFNTSATALSLVDFLSAVGQLKFRGTSHLLRSPISIAAHFKTRKADVRSLVSLASRKSNTSTIVMSGTEDARPQLFDSYDIAVHSIKVRKSGTILDVNSLWDIEHSGISGQPQQSKILVGQDINRILSFDSFNQDSQHNEMLNGLRFFQRAIPKDAKGGFGPKPPYDWGPVDRTSLGKCILTLCQKVREIMFSEPRLLDIPSPCYILGDIHGNFPDLLSFEKALWRLGPVLTPASFLFLGDYVDRGTYGVEVISYLFAQKVIAPTKFYLLRGNHEIREIQQMFSFFKECITKFGEKGGRDIWEAINSAFDCMPLAAVVDKRVFCVHGGIPPPWIGSGLLEVINTIPCPLPRPETTSPLSWELMWSDPLHPEMLTPEQRETLVLREGFGPNLRRGTAHVFNEEALEMFLAKNGVSHVIRAHEVQQAGFQVQLKGKLLTVFSSSKYCGGSNEAACILADKLKLRTIRIDTS